MHADANNTAVAELHELRHRFRNSLQTINSLVGLHARGITDPAALGAFADLRVRLTILSTIFMDLDGAVGGSVDLAAFLPQIAHKAANLQPGNAACPLDLDVKSAPMETTRAAILAQILAEMLMDGYRHCEPGTQDRPIEVRLVDGPAARLALTVGQRGCGDAGPATAARKLSQAIIGSMAMTLGATFEPAAPGGVARLEFAAAVDAG